jgi:hypothetical protein
MLEALASAPEKETCFGAGDGFLEAGNSIEAKLHFA